MLKLTCQSCGKFLALNSIRDFASCECGATLLPYIADLIDSVENQIIEINSEMLKRSNEGLCGKFKIDF